MIRNIHHKPIGIPGGALPLLLAQRTHLRGRPDPVRDWNAELDETLAGMAGHLPETVNAITDVGCGLAGISAKLWHHYDGEPDIHLVDYHGIGAGPQGGYHNSAGSFAYYNDMRAARWILLGAGVPAGKIHIHDLVAGPFPEHIEHDLVISLLSWGFHYPVTTYQPIFNTLVMDVRRGTPGEHILASWGACSVIHNHSKYRRILCKSKPDRTHQSATLNCSTAN